MELNSSSNKQKFLASSNKHVLILTIHGIHQWDVIPGLRDTGGQNIFVNQFANELVNIGYKVTIINRGGYAHPQTGEIQLGMHYKNSRQRIYYLEDGCEQFIKKENMGDRIPQLFNSLVDFIKKDNIPVDLLISNYWDAGILGVMLKQECLMNIKHIWVPHSLGAIKNRVLNLKQKEPLRIEERIAAERRVADNVDGIGATSSIICTSLHTDYEFKGKLFWLPPCVDIDRYYCRKVSENDPIWDFLSQQCSLPPEEIQKRRIISEISRTDTTKRKDVLIKAFAHIHKEYPDTFLIASIDNKQGDLAKELIALIHSCGVERSTAVVGSVWDRLPMIYAISDIYCTPSIMEGFGMSAQEAAATRVPVIASDKVAYVTEYLMGSSVKKIRYRGNRELSLGEGAIVVPADDVEGFRVALKCLLDDDGLRNKMAEAAFNNTIPYFTWPHIVNDFIKELDN